MEINNNMKLTVRRKNTRIQRDTSRVITRFHVPGDKNRISKIVNRVQSLTENQAEHLMAKLDHEFSSRHKNIKRALELHFTHVMDCISEGEKISEIKKMLIGAYFTMEYAIESAALFNPSIVPDPDQMNLPEGAVRFIMSLRATGEGHISSIVFRSGIIYKNNSVILNSTTDYVETPEIQINPVYYRNQFQHKLDELNANNETTTRVLEQMPDEFTYNELFKKIAYQVSDPNITVNSDAIEIIHWLAESIYEIRFHSECRMSERVIFPISENETSGIEDARFVQFFDENGKVTYYATYTAYNGIAILPQMIQTDDFLTFNIFTLNGKAVQNKGMALFPRKVNGQYVMLSRQDGENNFIMFSNHVHIWKNAQIIQEPLNPWEFIQIGNCGSPLETSEGWLVLTHGVGPMRQYSIGAMLLDLDDPTKIIARLNYPLLSPNEGEREGYVPNVVYTCGALIHNCYGSREI